ncbi:MAG: hypothetical protein LQ342_002537 [Letrouitia transgressa]|nr:MAG: hypothetical protein LQ342_002537 [Letrouitia transgressa]
MAKDRAPKEAEAAPKTKVHASPPPALIVQPPEETGGSEIIYRTGKELGKGGFAICYEGHQRGKSGSTVYALKIVKSKFPQKKLEDKFRTELQIHSKMQHPNIVEFHKAFAFEENTYVVLELCPNGSVQDMVRTRKGISLPEVRRLVVQLCGAVKYMHARNVIHRDLKMGNLFLDREMNVKIGDFGLAAVLVAPGEHESNQIKGFSRRTTLCGTPNYIAPEILDKSKGGHDLKVDIWALGCIVYAMLTARPPFQASSSTEIYEKAKTVNYSWPASEACRSFIPEEVKDLVAGLLKPNPEERLGLDDVVDHPFFSMNGGNCIPSVLDQRCKEKRPAWLLSEEPQGDVMHSDASRLRLSDLAQACGVGYQVGENKTFDVVGEQVGKSLYKACVEEEVAEACPTVPLPDDVVYSSKLSADGYLPRPKTGLTSSPRVPRTKSQPCLESLPEENEDENKYAAQIRRTISQGHAGALRMPQAGQAASKAKIRTKLDPIPMSENPSTVSRTQGIDRKSLQAPQRLMTERPLRLSRAASNTSSRTTRSQAMKKVNEDRGHLSDERSNTVKGLTTDQIIDQLSPNPDEKRRELAAQAKARIARNFSNEMKDESVPEKASLRGNLPVRPRKVSKTSAPTLIGPDEAVEHLPDSSATYVRSSLRKLYSELHEVLSFPIDSRPPSTTSKLKSRSPLPLIVKWVDYTNKFGIGYILDNGAVGILIQNEADQSTTFGILVGKAESHFRNRRHQLSYKDKYEVVPQSGNPIDFLEISNKEGVKRVTVPAARYRSNCGPEDALKLGPSADAVENERRRWLTTWDKFGKFMTQSLGEDKSSGPDTAPRKKRKEPGGGLFVRFYQRLGNVGVWGLSHGGFQLNFPDHTKLVVSADGKEVDYYCLPVEAARRLKGGEILTPQLLNGRVLLSHPVADILKSCDEGKTKDGEMLRENQFREKMEFARDAFGIWLKEGGLGCLGEEKQFHWIGMSEKRVKGGLTWASVGAKGGDLRYEVPAAKKD